MHPAREIASAHFLRYRSGTRAVDYLVAYQLGFLVRLFSCPAEERWEVFGKLEEEQIGIAAMVLEAIRCSLKAAILGLRTAHIPVFIAA